MINTVLAKKKKNRNEKEMEAMIQTKRIYNKNNKMNFGGEKCVMLIIKHREKTEKIERQNEECILFYWKQRKL